MKPITVHNGDFSRIGEVFKALSPDTVWQVTIEEKKNTRSINQHGLYFAHVTELAAEQGLTKDEVHLHNKRYFFLPIYERDGKPYPELRDTMDAMRQVYRFDKSLAEKMLIFVVNNISTTAGNTKQMAEAMEDIAKDAIVKFQLVLTMPGDPEE